MQKAQGALEYLLLIGGAVLVAVIVITLLLGIANQGQTDTQATTDSALSLIEQKRLEIIGGTSGTIYNVRFACVADDSAGGVSYNFSFPNTENGLGIISITNIDGINCSLNIFSGVEEITKTANPVTVIGTLGTGCDLISFTTTFPLTIQLMDHPTGGNNFSSVQIYPGDTSPKTLNNGASVTITESEINYPAVKWTPPVVPGTTDACVIYATSVVTP